MGILAWVVTGLIAGLLARAVVKDEKSGCVYTLVVGVLGAIIGGALMKAAGKKGINDFEWRTVAVAFLGACLLLLVLQAFGGIGGRRRSRSRRW
jgi:uncharacterized membrane protein YeaQ/YmgE (transglycosylase-associated protein family)